VRPGAVGCGNCPRTRIVCIRCRKGGWTYAGRGFGYVLHGWCDARQRVTWWLRWPGQPVPAYDADLCDLMDKDWLRVDEWGTCVKSGVTSVQGTQQGPPNRINVLGVRHSVFRLQVMCRYDALIMRKFTTRKSWPNQQTINIFMLIGALQWPIQLIL
jgi:hypothetical protein